MHRVPLSTPAHAAALVAVGFPRTGVKLDPLHHTGTGEKHMGWYYEGGNAEDAADLLHRRRPDLQNALWRSDCAHPFLAALAGAANFEVLEAWHKSPDAVPNGTLAHGGKLLLLLSPEQKADQKPPGALMAAPAPAPIYELQTPQGFHAVAEPDLAAALITVGFPPAPRLRASGGTAAYLIAHRSFLYPDLTLRAALEACRLMRDPAQLLPVQVEGFKAGQHPLQFAYAAAANYSTVPESERQAWPNVTHFIRGRRTALANAEALRNSSLEEQIMRHVAGL